MEEVDEENQELCGSDFLVQGLRCPVCLEYFVKPHTLPCGHTFCLRCLKTLVRLVRRNRERAPINRLRFRCPTCRVLNPVDAILQKKAAVNFAISTMIDEWFRSPYSRGRFTSVKSRSTAVQTLQDKEEDNNKLLGLVHAISPDGDIDVDAKPLTSLGELCISKDEIGEAWHFCPRFCTASQSNNPLNKPIEESSLEDASNTSNTDINRSRTTSDTDSPDEDVTSSDSDTPEEMNAPDRINVILQPAGRFRHTELCRFVRRCVRASHLLYRGIRESRSRLLLTFIWCAYGVMVVTLSRGFLPWICIYTIVFFIVLYLEIVHPML